MKKINFWTALTASSEYTLADGRSVKIEFMAPDNNTLIIEAFDAEDTHPDDVQRVDGRRYWIF